VAGTLLLSLSLPVSVSKCDTSTRSKAGQQRRVLARTGDVSMNACMMTSQSQLWVHRASSCGCEERAHCVDLQKGGNKAGASMFQPME
jgi:hypothetical protein